MSVKKLNFKIYMKILEQRRKYEREMIRDINKDKGMRKVGEIWRERDR